jgi:hypothetical protein
MGVRRAMTLLLAGVTVASSVGVAVAAPWSDGFYEGHAKRGNVCIAFEVRGNKVKRIEIKGAAEECGHRYRCSGELTRSAPGAGASNVPIKRNGRFRYELDVTHEPPRPGPPARRIATTITGKLSGREAKGTFRTLFDAGNGNRCDSGVLRWTAKRVSRDPGIGPGPRVR